MIEKLFVRIKKMGFTVVRLHNKKYLVLFTTLGSVESPTKE